MVDQVAEFLSKQERFRCERLSADLTTGQCEANRKRVPNIQKGINPVISCEGCAGLGKAVEIKERIMPPKSLDEIASVKPWAVKVCTECKEIKKIHGYGQCAKCLYKKYGKAMRPPKEEQAPTPLVKEAKPSKGFEFYTCPECSQVRERPIGQTECPACGYDPAAAESLDVSVECQERKPLHKLLSASPVLSLTLDFTNDAKLYAQLIEHGIDEDQIIELLSMLVSQELRRAA